MDNNFLQTLKIGFGVGAALTRHKLKQTREATQSLRFMKNPAVNALAKTTSIASQAIDTVTIGGYSDTGGPLDYRNRSEVGQARAITPQQFRERLAKSNFDLEKSPGLNSLMENMDPAYLKRIGHKSILQLVNDLEPDQVNNIAGHLSNHLTENKGDDLARQVAQDGLKDVAFPTSIKQGKENCGAVMLQQIWAHEQPESCGGPNRAVQREKSQIPQR